MLPDHSLIKRFPIILPLTFLCAATLAGAAFCSEQQTACTSPAAAEAESVRMVFGGDIVLGNNFLVENIPASWEGHYFAGVRSVFKDADIVFGNLEGVLSDRGETTKDPATGHHFAFRMPPRYAALLRQEGFNILNVANNHAYDFGESGFRDTLDHLRNADIAYVGPRDHLATLSVRGLNVSMLSFTYSSRFNSMFDMERNAELVRQAKAQGAYLIVTFHGGAEGSPAIWHTDKDEMFFGENRGNVVAFSRAMIDAGADLVVGHGPHVLREVECYRNRPIVYSLGNFVGVGGLSAQKLASVSAMLEISVNPNGALQYMNLVPLRFNGEKLPELDTRAFGTRLVNHLGQHARFDGIFVEFPVKQDEQIGFKRWLRSVSR